MANPKRHPKGAQGSRGGRFAAGEVAADVSSRDLGLTCISIGRYEDLTECDPIWGNTIPTKVSELEAYCTPEQHREYSTSQVDIADTAAEMWHAQGVSTQQIRELLRGVPNVEQVSSIEIELARNLQKSLLLAHLEEPNVFYRGIRNDVNEGSRYVDDLLREIEVGDVIEAGGFWSSSISPVVAARFCTTTNSDTVERDAALLRIESTVGKFLPSSSSLLYGFYDEHEVVLPHGVKYQVVGKTILKNDTLAEANDVPLVSLRYVGIDDQSAQMKILDEAEVDDSTKRATYIRENIDKWLDRYSKSKLPIGANTSIPIIQSEKRTFVLTMPPMHQTSS